MENILFVAKRTTDFEKNKRVNKLMTTTPATTSMTQTKESNKNIRLNLTTHLLYKNRWKISRQSQCINKFTQFSPVTITTPDHSSFINVMKFLKQHVSFDTNKQKFCLMFCLLMLLVRYVHSFEITTSPYKSKETDETSSTVLYSQLLSTNGQISMFDNAINKNDDTFRPYVLKDPALMSHNVFTPSGKFHIFQPIDTDLRGFVSVQQKSQLNSSPQHEIQQITRNQKHSIGNIKITEAIVQQKNSSNLSSAKHHNKVKRTHEFKHQFKQPFKVEQNETSKLDDFATEWKSLQDLLVDYITNFYEKGQYEPMPGLLVELQNNHSQPLTSKARSIRQTVVTDAKIRLDLPRTLATGRLLFLTGLKKVLWPVFVGLQVLKSLLIAMFIPALIGSFTKLLGKGISTGSAPLFIRPMEPAQELDFRDNSLNFDDDNKFLVTNEGIKNNGPYAYNQPDASQMNNEYVFDPSSNNNQLSYTRLGMNERQHQLMQDSYMNALQSIGSASFKNSGSLSSGSSGLVAPMAKRPPPAANVNTFQQFQNVPDSSLLLSNYDPFYSPLLSRLDSVFAQLKINSDKEICREKLICLMYANPAKYAPYSNLVSAQLSRELNELRKPTSDNPDILRFFKYMRAAKDGQDGVDCEKTFDKCTEFKDFENPAMVSTYHDINKLVQARKFK